MPSQDFSVVFFAVLGLVLVLVVAGAATGLIGPNSFAGVRTDAFRRDPGSWRRGHRWVLPFAVVGFVLQLVVSIALRHRAVLDPGLIGFLADLVVLAVGVVYATARLRR